SICTMCNAQKTRTYKFKLLYFNPSSIDGATSYNNIERLHYLRMLARAHLFLSSRSETTNNNANWLPEASCIAGAHFSSQLGVGSSLSRSLVVSCVFFKS